MGNTSTTNVIDYSTAPKVLQVKNLRINFKTDTGTVYAVRGVSFDLYKGETLCIVGESGSGKSVTSKTIMGILASNAIVESGQILYEGEDLIRISEEEFHRIRGHKIGMIFQDPLSSLNPIMRVGKQITEATLISRNVLKRHYNDLISKQLVALRNADANSYYEHNKIKEEKKTIKKYLDILNNKKEEPSEEDLSAIREYISLLDSNVLEEISSLQYQIDSLKHEDIGENKYLEEKINTTSIVSLEERVTYLQEFYNYIKERKETGEIEETKEILNKREEFLDNQAKYIDKNLKVTKPLYKKALNLRKKDAKIENKAYKKQIVSEHKQKYKDIENELKEVEKEIKKLVPTLDKDQKAIYKNVIKKEKDEKKTYSIFARWYADSQIKDTQTNVSKTVKKEEVKETTGNEEFDALMFKRKDLREELKKEYQYYCEHIKISRKEAKRMALDVMREVGIPLPEKRFYQYPFEFSGGMRQRIVIAIALTANPDILICDEPTTALDVTIQAQILELINRLKKERGLSCIFITHDLGVVANMADRVAVMYAGKIVEYGTAYEVFYNPKHPYTWALLSSIPDIDSKEKLEAIAGTPPDMRFPPKGDAFALRSKYALAIDFKYEPPFFKVSDTHYAATWLLHENAPHVEMPKIVTTRIANSLKQFEEQHYEDSDAILSQIPAESFTYQASDPENPAEFASNYAKNKVIKKSLKAYQHIEDNPASLVKEDLNDELNNEPPADELKGIKENAKEEAIHSIKAKCKHNDEYEKDNVILSVNHLKQYFFFGNVFNRYKLKAVHDVSFKVYEGECFGIVGESGCGKTTTGRCIMRLYHITSGSIYYKGYRIAAGSRWNEKEIKYTKIRYRKKLKEIDKASKADDSTYENKVKELKKDLKTGGLYSWEYEEELANAKNDRLASKLARENEKKEAKEYKDNIIKVQKAKISQIKYDDTHARDIITDPGYEYGKIAKEIKATYKENVKKLESDLSSNAISKETYDAKKAELDAKLKQDLADNKAKEKNAKVKDEHVSKRLINELQMIFQDPVDSLDPRMTVEDIIQEGLVIQGYHNKKENHQKVVDVLEKVGLIEDYCNRYPHEFSGGQRQRIGIARALIMNPKLLICDEPISALDVSIRAQIINLLNELKEEYGLSMIFIAHDLSVVKYFCDRIAVMYYGELVELAPSDELFKHPLHPYTKSLLSAIPKPNPLTEKERVRIVYDPSKEHDYSKEKPSFVEIEKDHFVLASPSEVAKYKEEIIELDAKAAEEEAEKAATATAK